MDPGLKKTPLWPILVDTAKSLPLYRQHRNYVEEVILPSEPGVTTEELSTRMGISLGEALVILSDLAEKG